MQRKCKTIKFLISALFFCSCSQVIKLDTLQPAAQKLPRQTSAFTVLVEPDLLDTFGTIQKEIKHFTLRTEEILDNIAIYSILDGINLEVLNTPLADLQVMVEQDSISGEYNIDQLKLPDDLAILLLKRFSISDKVDDIKSSSGQTYMSVKLKSKVDWSLLWPKQNMSVSFSVSDSVIALLNTDFEKMTIEYFQSLLDELFFYSGVKSARQYLPYWQTGVKRRYYYLLPPKFWSANINLGKNDFDKAFDVWQQHDALKDTTANPRLILNMAVYFEQNDSISKAIQILEPYLPKENKKVLRYYQDLKKRNLQNRLVLDQLTMFRLNTYY